MGAIDPKTYKKPSPYKTTNLIGAPHNLVDFGGAVKFGEAMTKKAKAIMEKMAKKDMPSFLNQDRDPKAKEVYRALKHEHPEYSAGKKARIAESVANKS
jgi:hypothetical protein